jgi:hypothetical protein
MSTIILKKSSVSGKVPLVGDLVFGELALNYADGKLYYKTSGNLINYIANGGTFTTALSITSSTQATSTTTGALIVTGGAGIGGNLAIGGALYAGGITGTNNQLLSSTGNGISWTSTLTVDVVNAASNMGINGINSRYGFSNNVALTGGTTVGSFNASNTIQSDVTVNAYGVLSSMNTQAASFTLNAYRAFSAGFNTVGAGSTITNAYGFNADSSLGTAATNAYGLYSGIASGASKWNVHAAGTAQNWFAGNVGIGTGKSVPSVALDVAGTVTATNVIVANTLTISGVLSAGGTTGTNGQVLISTGNGVSWTTLSSSFNGGTITGALTINNSTGVSSTQTGALQVVNGGVGIGGGLFVGGTITATQITVNGFPVSTGTSSGSSFNVQEFTATGGQTTFTVSAGYTVGQIQVFANGINLAASDFTATNGSTVVLGTARNAGDIIRVMSLLTAASGTTNNLSGGTTGQVPFQTAAGATSFFGAGTAGQLLVSQGASASGPIFTNTGSIYVGYANTATTATNAATAYSLANTGTTHVGTANFAVSAATATNAATAYALANTGTTHVGTANFAVSSTQVTTVAQPTVADYFLTFVDTNSAAATAKSVYTTSSLTINAASGGIRISGITTVTNTTAASSTSTGALQVRGGVGIGGNLYAEQDGYFNGIRIGLGNGSISTNLAAGSGALDTVTTGTNNIAVGYLALNSNQSGANNVAVGYQAAYLSSNLFAATAIGSGALQNVTSGQYNIGIGYNAGLNITTGGNNTIIGSVSGTAGLSNTVIIAAGTTERLRVDGSNLYINGTIFTGGGSGGLTQGQAVAISMGMAMP